MATSPTVLRVALRRRASSLLRRTVHASAWLGVLVSLSQGATAETALTYHVEIGAHSCTDAASFGAMLRARATSARATDDTAVADIQLDVAVEESPDGKSAQGRLTVSRDTTVSTREVTGASCAEAADALALIAAMIMDTEAQERAAREKERADSLPEEPLEEPPMRPRQPVTPPHWSLAISASGMLTGSVGPGSDVGFLTSVGGRRDVSDSVFDWDFGTYFAMTPASGIPNSRGRSVNYRWWATGLSGCPVSWPPGPVRLRGCVSFEGGLLTRTETFPNQESDSSEWLAITAGFRWQWAMLPWLELELAASGVFPLLRGTFNVYPEVGGPYNEYTTESFTGRATAGLTFALPL